LRAISSAVERFLYTEDVGGSIPSSPTNYVQVTDVATPHLIAERDDERFQIGLRRDRPGPFEMRQFAEAAIRESRHARTS
jgi:hypothetical protein